MDQLVVAEEYIIENVDDEVHVERSAVTNESQEQSNQPLKIEIVNKKPASPNLNNSISEHSYSFNTEKPSNADNDNILDVENSDSDESDDEQPPILKVKPNQKPNFSNMALVAMALQNLPEKRGTGKKKNTFLKKMIGFQPFFNFFHEID